MKTEVIRYKEFVLDKFGLDFKENQLNELYAKTESAAEMCGFDDTDLFIDHLLEDSSDQEYLKNLAKCLTIGETYFFRDSQLFNYLHKVFLPELIHKRKHSKNIKIWSAGCSSGEEPYSIAILLRKLLPNIDKWNITIDATDINLDFLEKAKNGNYREWSFRTTDPSVKLDYFEKLGQDKYQIKDNLKEMVNFSYLNLNADIFPNNAAGIKDYDLILCRNVFIYFSDEVIANITSGFYKSLNLNGVFITSPVECGLSIHDGLQSQRTNGVTIFSKEINNNSHLAKTFINPSRSYGLSHRIKEARRKVERVVENSHGQYEILTETKSHPKEIVKTKKIEPTVKANSKRKLAKENISPIDESLLKAKKLADSGDFEASEKICDELLKKNKTNKQVHYLMASINYERGNYKKALVSLTNVIFLDPDFALAHYMQGVISTQIGKEVESARHFKNAMRCLRKLNQDYVLDKFENLTAGSLLQVIKTIHY